MAETRLFYSFITRTKCTSRRLRSQNAALTGNDETSLAYRCCHNRRKLRSNAYKHTRTFAHASSHRDTSNKHPTLATNGGTWFDAVVVAVAWREVSTAHPERLYEWTEKVFVVCFVLGRTSHIFTVFSFVHCRICTPKKRRRNSKFHWSSPSAGGLFSLWQNVTAWARREQCIKLRHFSLLFSFLFITKIWLQSFSPSSLASCLKTLNYSLFFTNNGDRLPGCWNDIESLIIPILSSVVLSVIVWATRRMKMGCRVCDARALRQRHTKLLPFPPFFNHGIHGDDDDDDCSREISIRRRSEKLPESKSWMKIR